MAALRVLLSLFVAFAFRGVAAQQFPERTIDYSVFGLSPSCVAVLNTTITCNSGLGALASPGSISEYLKENELNALCTTGCRSALTNLRTSIISACGSTDVMLFDNIAYPATYMADRYLFAYDVSCYKDRATGRYCDLILAEARNSSTSADCTDCMLGVFRLQLSSPVGYSPDFAEDFTSVTASCGATGYGYSTPAPYGSTVTSQPPGGTGTPTCHRPYTVAAGDTCKSISQAQRVSTYGLISMNNLDFSCATLPGTLCLPDECATHTWSESDSCGLVTQQYNVSMTRFLTWNPIFDPYCANAGVQWAGWTLCVGPPGGEIPALPTPSAVPVPENAKDDSEKNCAQWHTVLEGESCYTILPPGSSISFAQFRAINPSVDAECTNLWLGYAYCISPVQPPPLNASTTFTRPPSTSPPPITLPPTTTTTLPHAPSSPPSCTAWVNYDDAPASQGDVLAFDMGLMANIEDVDYNSCSYVAFTSEISLLQFLVWNPSLVGGSECTLSPGLSYCIGIEGSGSSVTTTPPGSSSIPSSTSSSPPSSTSSGVPIPSPTQPGTIPTCKRFHLVVSGDGCWAITQIYGITLDDFFAWNTGIDVNCSNLWLDNYVCVGI